MSRSTGLPSRPGRAPAAMCGLAVLAATAACLTMPPEPSAAAARPVSACSSRSGVIVAVDFATWGGPLLRSCGTTPTTGFALLNQGGWHTTGTEHDGPGFICRIGYNGFRGGVQYPTARQESCVLTPPASAYWASWHAAPGQNAWTYSQAGAASYRPAPGSVELWVFGGTNLGGTAGSAVPAVSPASIRAAGSAAPGGQAIVNASPMSHNATAGSGSPAPSLITLALIAMVAVAAAAARRRTRGPR